MTAMTLDAASPASVASTLRKLARALGEAVDAFAAYRIQRAVPEVELLRSAREIARYRTLMQARPNRRS